MFGFGKDKKKEEEEAKEKAKQEQISQAMRSMSDQLAAKGQEITDLEKQLEAAKKEAATGDAAEKALADAQAKMRQMQAEMAKLQSQAHAAQAAATKATAEAAAATKASAGAVLSGAVAAGAASVGGLAVGATAYVRNEGGKNLRLRDKPGLESNAFAGLPPGTSMTLLEGPVQDDGYPWWRVRVSDGREGWVAGTELVTQPN